MWNPSQTAHRLTATVNQKLLPAIVVNKISQIFICKIPLVSFVFPLTDKGGISKFIYHSVDMRIAFLSKETVGTGSDNVNKIIADTESLVSAATDSN